jgi:hypothetical protein
MSITEHLQSYVECGDISADLDESLDNPTERYALYKFLVNEPARPYRQLLLRILDKEIAFRTALWNGDQEARKYDETSFEGIRHCAYLLSRCGEPTDVRAIWKAQYLDQDVGELEVGNFVGAGTSETLAFLDNASDDVSHRISEYIRDSLNHPEAFEWLASWETDRHNLLAGTQ